LNQFAEGLGTYWSAPVVQANLLVILNVAGALALGLAVGYERSFHGRAAGMRTYGLVCMASCALTVIAGYPAAWFGGHAAISTVDPTRVIQGIVTGIGFLGAGVIVKEGFNISGLNTAASIWTSSAIGVMVGLGFYPAAIALATLAAVCMSVISRVEQRLPAHSAVAITVRHHKGFLANEETLRKISLQYGYELGRGSLSIDFVDGQAEWHFVAIARDRRKGASVSELAHTMSLNPGVERFNVSPTRQ
jgi:putative Mg2+ transporter-C (MgtC) family protein